MSLSESGFTAIWGTSVLAWLALSYQYYGKWKIRKSEIGDKIRSFNARRGYDQSVGRGKLAKEFLLPILSSHTSQFANNNGVTVDEYTSEMNDALNELNLIGIALIIQFLGVLYTIGGLTFYTSVGFFDPLTYSVTVYIFLAIGFVFYWVS